MNLINARRFYNQGDAVSTYRSLAHVYEKAPKSLTESDRLIMCRVADNLGQDKFLLNFLEDSTNEYKTIKWLSKLYRQYKKINILDENKINQLSIFIQNINSENLDSSEKYTYSMLNFLLGREYKKMYSEAIYALETMKNQVQKNKFDPAIALDSTLELIEEIKKRVNKQPFLIGGTLLGMIREGHLLGHDKDTDIGIHYDQGIDYFKIASDIAIKTRFKTPQLFSTFYENRSKVITFFDSSNKVTIDLFIFKNDTQYIFQELTLLGGNIRWNYPIFHTEKINIGGLNYPIPSKPEIFLNHNFGADWKISKAMWDSLIHCPNIPLDCRRGKIYICLKKQFEELKKGNYNKSQMYKKYITEELK